MENEADRTRPASFREPGAHPAETADAPPAARDREPSESEPHATQADKTRCVVDPMIGSTSPLPRKNTASSEIRQEAGTTGPRAVWNAPRFLGNYELLDELARGGMGVIYRARQTHLNRVVALKLVRDARLASYAELSRFRIEAEAVAQLDHPNIVPIHEVGQVDDQPFFSMKLIEGGNLSTRVDALKENPRAAASLMAKVARAVQYAHQHAILHRDLKPSNILVDDQDEPYVTDFGLAKRIGADAGGEGTVTGAVMGTPAYMPPEQARGGAKSATTAADVYSLGATLYELVSGRPPFSGDSITEILRRVSEEPPSRPRDINPKVDRDLETICLKCLEKEPERRYASAGAFASDLENWLAGVPISARPSTVKERAVKWVRRHRALAGLITVSAASLVIVVLGGLFFILRLGALLEDNRNQLYFSKVNLAARAIKEYQPVLADGILDGLDSDRRGFEWSFLKQFTHPRVLTGHTSMLRSVAMDPLGRFVVSCGEDRQVRLWRLDADDSGVLLERADASLMAIVVSPDGKLIAFGGYDKKVSIWESSPPRFLKSLDRLSSKVWDIAFGADSKRLAIQLGEEVRVVDVESEQETYRLSKPTAKKPFRIRSRSVAFSPDGRLLAATHDEVIVLYAAANGAPLRTLKGHKNPISSLSFSPDSARLASSSEDGTVLLWDLSATSKFRTIEGVEPSPGLASDAGRRVVEVVNEVVFSPNGRFLAAASLGNRVRIWSVEDGTEVRTLPHARDVQSAAFHPDGNSLATGDGDGVVRIWNISESQSTRIAAHPGGVKRVAARPGGGQFASIGVDRSIAFWPIGSDLKVGVPSRFDLESNPRALAYRSDGRFLAAAGDDGTIHVWDTSTLRVVKRLTQGQVAVMSLAFSSNGSELTVVGTQASVKVWDWESGRIVRELPGHEGTVRAVAYSPDGRRLATADGEKVIRLWNADNGRREAELRLEAAVNSLAFSPDGRLLVAVSDDRDVSYWDLSAWSPQRKRLEAHSSAVLDVCFLPDSKRPRIATAGADRAVKLWHLDTGLDALTLSEHSAAVNSVCFGADGGFMLSGGSDGDVRLWIAPGYPPDRAVR